MNYTARYLFLLVLWQTISSMNILVAQNLDQHLWEHRIIVLQTSDLHSSLYQEQLSVLTTAPEGLEERKLLVYQVDLSQRRYKFGLEDSGTWQPLQSSIEKTSNPTFEFLLIGLDGGTKWRSTQLVSTTALFAKIDQMPMRRQELKKKNR